MRFPGSSSVFRAKAIAGTHVVVLAWDLKPNQRAKLKGLMGFAIRRSEFDGNTLVESYTLRSIKRFKDKDKGYPPGTPVSTQDHPLQTFQWGDYTARPDRTYEYQIVPMYGEPKLLVPNETTAVTIKVRTSARRARRPGRSLRHKARRLHESRCDRLAGLRTRVRKRCAGPEQSDIAGN
jgi:hypothetical protein